MLFTDVEQFKSFWVNGLPKCFSLRADTRAIINEKRGVRRNLFKINDLIRFTQAGLRQSPNFLENQESNVADWKEIGILDPKPFENVQFFAPRQKGMATRATTGRTSGDVTPYS